LRWSAAVEDPTITCEEYSPEGEVIVIETVAFSKEKRPETSTLDVLWAILW
jgi:hypothetical protein